MFAITMSKRGRTWFHSRRKALGLSVEQVAVFVGFSGTHVRYWEAGVRPPPIARADELAAIYQTTLADMCLRIFEVAKVLRRAA